MRSVLCLSRSLALSVSPEIPLIYTSNRKEGIEEKWFQTHHLAVTLTLFGSIAKFNQFVCWLQWWVHINPTNIHPLFFRYRADENLGWIERTGWTERRTTWKHNASTKQPCHYPSSLLLFYQWQRSKRKHRAVRFLPQRAFISASCHSYFWSLDAIITLWS